ncbi:putative ubiquitin-conjugating enzyme E2 38 [Fagus crenata]
MKQFKQFDIVSDNSDHYFAKINFTIFGKKKACFTNENSRVHKKIMQEREILKNNLPESIYVRVYEERIDLLRVFIVGDARTPYHDGLFFFDFAFPSNYPKSPPKAYYHAHRLYLNPNLSLDGRVHLKNVEKLWNPSSSTILQVLSSLQLVLNEKPYYNDRFLDIFNDINEEVSFNEEASKYYNNIVFLLSCKTMLCLLRKPPRNFEDFVYEHFCCRASFILQACNAYIEGCARVGYYNNDGSHSSSSTIEEFEALMCKLYPDLKAALTENAASIIKSVSPIEAVFIKFAADGLDQSHRTNNEDLRPSNLDVTGCLCIFGLVLLLISTIFLFIFMPHDKNTECLFLLSRGMRMFPRNYCYEQLKNI